MTENNTIYETATTFTPSAASQSKTMRCYDLKKNWRRVKPHLVDKKLNDILVRDFNKFATGRWGRPFVHGNLPSDFESCDWRLDHRGKHPAFWRYVKHAACHWLVNFTLRLATLVKPKRPWRIITSVKHSTVWDGDDTIFDFNFQALGIDPITQSKQANITQPPTRRLCITDGETACSQSKNDPPCLIAKR